MREIPIFKDTRLLEALDYIDRDLIAEVVNDIKAPDADEIPGQNKKAVWRSVKHTLLFAACLVLIPATTALWFYDPFQPTCPPQFWGQWNSGRYGDHCFYIPLESEHCYD